MAEVDVILRSEKTVVRNIKLDLAQFHSYNKGDALVPSGTNERFKIKSKEYNNNPPKSDENPDGAHYTLYVK